MNWKLFFLAFLTLFLAEIGDKTQLAVFSLAAESRSPLTIFLGASLALVLITFIGAFFGGFITRFIPLKAIRVTAALLFIGIGLTLIWQILKTPA
jgi:putative Ca2+/H+ antiporter (TMEM165/GDT1 family)